MGVRQDTAVDRTLPERGPDSAQPARAANSPEINDCQEPNPISNAAQTQLELHCHNSSREACGPEAQQTVEKGTEEMCLPAETKDGIAVLPTSEAHLGSAEPAHPHQSPVSSKEACGPAALRETCKSAEEVCWAAETNDDFAALSEPEAPVAAAELAHPHHAGREPHKRCVHASTPGTIAGRVDIVASFEA